MIEHYSPKSQHYMTKIPYLFSATTKNWETFNNTWPVASNWKRSRDNAENPTVAWGTPWGPIDPSGWGLQHFPYRNLSTFPMEYQYYWMCIFFQAKISNHGAWIYLLSLPLIKLVFANCVTYHRWHVSVL